MPAATSTRSPSDATFNAASMVGYSEGTRIVPGSTLLVSITKDEAGIDSGGGGGGRMAADADAAAAEVGAGPGSDSASCITES